jgi:hypothetical protein
MAFGIFRDRIGDCRLNKEQFYDVLFVAQYAKAKEASPIIFIMANVRVAHLPQSKISSLIRRPIVPTISSIKAIKSVYSRMDVPPYIVSPPVYHRGP